MISLKTKNMKKLFITSILVLGFSLTSLAQGKGDVEFGFNVGLNSSSMVVSNSNLQPNPGNGFNAGFAGDYYFSDRWSIKGKLIFEQKGWNNGFYEYQPGKSYITNYNLNYLTIPIMANLHLGRKREWYLNFGPYAGFLVSADETSGGTNVKDIFNTTDFGLALGVGLKLPLSDKLKIFFEYDGQAGITNTFKVNNGVDIRNSRSAFNVGLNFLMK